MKGIRLVVAAAAFSLVSAPIVFAGQAAGRPHAAVPHGHAGQHGATAGQHGAGASSHGAAAGDHGKAGQPHGQAGQHDQGAAEHGQAGDRGQADQHGQAAQEHGNASGSGIADRISRNPQLKARLEAMLPAGMSLSDAASGFRNQGQFIAALETSKNLNIPFADLKAQMTGDHGLSLGQAIEKLKPGATAGTGGEHETPDAPDADND